MQTTIMPRLDAFLAHYGYWGLLVFGGLVLEAVALFYQHVLNVPPCVLCIHARLWVLGMIAAGLVGLALRRYRWGRVVAQLGLVVSLAGLLERSWVALQVERGTYDGDCGMDPGFPGWLPLDDWFPNLFQVWSMCGYSPSFLFGLSMVEALTYGTAIVLVAAVSGLGVIVWQRD